MLCGLLKCWEFKPWGLDVFVAVLHVVNTWLCFYMKNVVFGSLLQTDISIVCKLLMALLLSCTVYSAAVLVQYAESFLIDLVLLFNFLL